MNAMVTVSKKQGLSQSTSMFRSGRSVRSSFLELDEAEEASKTPPSPCSLRSTIDYDVIDPLTSSTGDDGTDSSDDGYSCRVHGTDGTMLRCRENDNNTIATLKYNYTKEGKHCEVGKYMAAREMTPFQERMNALTILPSTYYCIMFLLSGSWLTSSFKDDHGSDFLDKSSFDESECMSLSWLPNFHALPPPPVVSAAIGILCHAPFSMIYHWKYAHRLPPGLPRTNHWSRRMDQAMIHFLAACLTYSTSGRLDFFLLNLLFNLDCMYRQFLKEVRPRRNQSRIAIAAVAVVIPILKRGDFGTFLELFVLFAIAGWLFGQYPIGGWSHSVFHIVLAFIPPIMFSVALDLPASQSQLELAAHCSILADNLFVN